MKKIWYLAVLILAGYANHAQNLKVLDAQESEPLERAKVQVYTDDLIPIYTDDRGIVDISIFKNKKQIRLRRAGSYCFPVFWHHFGRVLSRWF